VLFLIGIPEDELGLCWYAGLLSALAGWSHCLSSIRSGICQIFVSWFSTLT